MIQVSAVPFEYVDDVWPHVKKHLRRALSMQGKMYTLESIKEMMERKALALWVMVDDETGDVVAASTTRIIEYPECRAMAIDWIGGRRMKEWLPQLAQIMDAYAKDHGCSHIEGGGRAGWVKALAPYGYKPWMPTYRKDLTDG